METKCCTNNLPHMFHQFPQQVEVQCSGKTRCLIQEHQPHIFLEIQEFWCNGICDCGLRNEIHGPGAHK